LAKSGFIEGLGTEEVEGMKWPKGNEINGLCVGLWVYVVVFWTISEPELTFPKRAMKLGVVPFGSKVWRGRFAGCMLGGPGEARGLEVGNGETHR